MSLELPQQPLLLTTKQKQFLKGLAHSQKPIVQIGKEGLTSRVIDTIGFELLNHELIKVKIGNNSGLERHETSKTVAEKTNSSLVQLIGKIIVLYKVNPDKPKDKRIILPKAK